MLKKNLRYLLGALMLILWAGQPGQSQSPPEIPRKKKACGDLWPVHKDKKWGYIDKTGRIIIPFKFDGAEEFSEGLEPFILKRNAAILIRDSSPFSEERAVPERTQAATRVTSMVATFFILASYSSPAY